MVAFGVGREFRGWVEPKEDPGKSRGWFKGSREEANRKGAQARAEEL